ncbi:MAG: hypothetical protein BWK79_05305 [Beggiatoa sp. IS2]|nr:MAG: hypothetical protein BWK79_05305 [Beggiatoa sp. IS2]
MILIQISKSMAFIESMKMGIEIENGLLASRKAEREALPKDSVPELLTISNGLIKESEGRVQTLSELHREATLFMETKMLKMCKQALERRENGETNLFWNAINE